MKTKSVTLGKIKKRFSIIKTQVSQIVENKYIYDKFRKYLKDNNVTDMDKSGDFLRFVVNNYKDVAIVNVCKQIDEDTRSESFINLLKDIKKNANLIKQEWYLEDVECFKDFFNKKTKKIKKTSVEADIKEIGRIIGRKSERPKKSRRFLRDNPLKLRHKRKAHYNKSDFKSSLVTNDLDKAIDTLEKKVLKYDGLINGVGEPGGLLDMNIDDHLKLNTLFRPNT